MLGLRPENLTNSELMKYAHLYGVDNLPLDWLKEIARRFIIR